MTSFLKTASSSFSDLSKTSNLFEDLSKSSHPLVLTRNCFEDLSCFSSDEDRSRFFQFFEKFQKQSLEEKDLFYHTQSHYGKVLLSTVVVSGQNPVPLPLLVASALHDYAYDKDVAKTVGAAEKNSFFKALKDGFLDDFSSQEKDVVFSLILATTPSFRQGLRDKTLLTSPSEFSDLRSSLEKNGVVEQAYIISDSDLLSSSGISLKSFRNETRRLEQELNLDFTPQMSLNFMKNFVGPYLSSSLQKSTCSVVKNLITENLERSVFLESQKDKKALKEKGISL